MSFTSWSVAQPGANPVEVLTYATPVGCGCLAGGYGLEHLTARRVRIYDPYMQHSGPAVRIVDQSDTKVSTIERAIQILEAFSYEEPALGLSELARRTALPKSTVHRILKSLKQNRLVIQLEDGRYAIGIRLFELGSLAYANLGVRSVAQPYIRALTESTGETVHLGILDEYEVVSIEQALSPHTLRAEIYIGKRAPLYCTAVGKILAAYQDDAWIAAYLESPREKHTPNTITDRTALEREFRRVRERGYAVDNEEHNVGIRCIAVPVFDRGGKVVASLSISGPAVRVRPEKDKEHLAQLARTATEISQVLGFRGQFPVSAVTPQRGL